MSRHVHRYLCDVLEEMRTADKGKNYSYMGALIEEVQVLGNRMEAALGEKQDCEWYHNKGKELEAANKDLEAKKKKLEAEVASLKGQRETLLTKVNRLKLESRSN